MFIFIAYSFDKLFTSVPSQQGYMIHLQVLKSLSKNLDKLLLPTVPRKLIRGGIIFLKWFVQYFVIFMYHWKHLPNY